MFSVKKMFHYKNIILDKVSNFGIEVVDINNEGILLSDEDTAMAARKFKEKKVDAVFTPNCNFGTENAVANLVKELSLLLLLWGPRDKMTL